MGGPRGGLLEGIPRPSRLRFERQGRAYLRPGGNVLAPALGGGRALSLQVVTASRTSAIGLDIKVADSRREVRESTCTFSLPILWPYNSDPMRTIGVACPAAAAYIRCKHHRIQSLSS